MFQFSEARKRDLVPQLFFIESSVGPLHLTEQSLQSLAHAPRARTRQKSLDRRYSLARAPRATHSYGLSRCAVSPRGRTRLKRVSCIAPRREPTLHPYESTDITTHEKKARRHTL